MQLSDLAGIPQSTAPAVREYLYTNLTAVLPADGEFSLQVGYDNPGPYQANDIVCVGDVALEYEPGSLVGSGSAGWLRERYEVTVTIDVFRGGDNPLLTYNRAQYLSDLVCAVVRYDVSLNKLVISATPKSSHIENEWDENNEGRHSFATVQISCYAPR